MAKGDVTFQLDADQAKAVQSFLRVVDSQKKAENQFGRTTRSARQQDRRMEQVRKTVGKLTTALGAGAGLAGAVSLVRTEFRNLVELQNEALRLNERLAGPRSELLSITADLGAERPGLARRVRQLPGRLAEERGIPERIATQAAAEAFSRTTGAAEQRVERTRIATRAAARLGRATPQEIPGLAPGLVTVARNAPRAETAEGVIGRLQLIRSQAPISDVQKLTRAVGPSAKAVQQAGGTFATAGGLLSALATQAEDPEGRKTSNALISLSKAFRQFFGDREGAPETFRGQLRALQTDAGLRAQFFEQQGTARKLVRGVPKQIEPALRNLLTDRQSEVAQAAISNIEAFTPEGIRQAQQAFFRARRRDPAIQTALLGQRFGVSQERQLATRGRGALVAQLRQGLFGGEQGGGLLQAAGESRIGQRLNRLLFEIRTARAAQPAQRLRNILSDRAAELEEQARRRGGFEVVTQGVLSPNRFFRSRERAQQFLNRPFIRGRIEAPTQEERRQAQDLRERADRLQSSMDKLIDRTEQALEAIEQTAENTGGTKQAAEKTARNTEERRRRNSPNATER